MCGKNSHKSQEDQAVDFYLDLKKQCLFLGEQEIALRPKAFAVLQYLMRYEGQVVEKDKLLEAVWGGVIVGEQVLKGCIRELRRILGDDPKEPRFIQTYPRKGYRFIYSHAVIRDPAIHQLPAVYTGSGQVFGRQAEMERLESCLGRALRGERQVVFVSGENGIGKTALVDHFLARASRDSEVLIAYGQCRELYGKGEAYMPVLEALERVGREAGTERLIPLLNRHAPTWLVQMSSLVDDQAQEALQRRVVSATPGRMLREIAMALEALTAEIPMVLVLEDLHWSDYSTIDFISSLARRRESARLLLIGTYRPTPVNTEGHPLRVVHRNLRLYRQCVDLVLSGLKRRSVEDYLATRLAQGKHSVNLVEFLFRLTDGNPLFMSTMVEDLLERGYLVRRDGFWQLDQQSEELMVADSLQQMIQEKLEALSDDDQRLLEAASVAGIEFSALVLAAAVQEDVAEVEQRYADLARRGQFLRLSRHSSDGAQANRYAFRHALHQSVLYQHLTVARRVQWHRLIGEALEASQGERTEDLVAALATHFERGRTHRKAVEYHVLAARKAIRRAAYREAVHHLNRGLGFMKLLPDNEECRRQEQALQTALGNALIATRGYGVEEVGQCFMRAYELSQMIDMPEQELEALWGLAMFRVSRAEFAEAKRLGEECLSRGQREKDVALCRLGHRITGMALYHLGQPAAAREHLEMNVEFDDQGHGPRLGELEESLVYGRSLLGLVLWILGYPDQALQRVNEAVTLASRIAHPMSLACARHHRGMVHYLRRDVAATHTEARALLKIAHDHDLPLWSAWGNLLCGWARSMGQPSKAIPQLNQALDAWRATGARSMVPTYLGIIASAFCEAGNWQRGLSMIDEALEMVDEFGEHLNVGELWRLKGKLARSRNPEEAEAYLRQALRVACDQQALSWELWAALSLTRALRQRNHHQEAEDILARVYSKFTEGFDTEDLRKARASLEKMSRQEPYDEQPCDEPGDVYTPSVSHHGSETMHETKIEH